jgi:ribosomal-protein-alanine N-acetyltransferase
MLINPIEAERLRIRRLTADDWQDVHAFTSDAATMTYRPEGQMTPEQTQAYIAEHLGEEPRAYAVDLLAENRLIGLMDFHLWYGPRTFEIGWVINPRYQGQGFATEAAAALLRYGFETLQLHRIIATCQPENPASYRVMEKIGMRREGHFRKCHLHDETTWWDEYFYALLAEEWFAAHSK